jgi:hypothetical protein
MVIFVDAITFSYMIFENVVYLQHLPHICLPAQGNCLKKHHSGRPAHINAVQCLFASIALPGAGQRLGLAHRHSLRALHLSARPMQKNISFACMPGKAFLPGKGLASAIATAIFSIHTRFPALPGA